MDATIVSLMCTVILLKILPINSVVIIPAAIQQELQDIDPQRLWLQWSLQH